MTYELFMGLVVVILGAICFAQLVTTETDKGQRAAKVKSQYKVRILEVLIVVLMFILGFQVGLL